MNKILVTGGAGYIGSHTCKALANAGFLPITYDNLSQGHEWAVQWGPFVQGDLNDGSLLIKILQQEKIAAVMHFAACATVSESIQQPEAYYANNVGGTLSLLKAMKESGVNQIVFSSTCAIYGVPQYLPIDENHLQAPINPYGFTKLIVERMLQDFSVAHGFRSISLRYFNAAGGDAQAGIGECHSPETHLIPQAIHAMMGLNPALTLFGLDYPTPDGSCIRDYVHITDLAHAHILALRSLLSSQSRIPFYTAYNLGSEQGTSVYEVIQSVERVSKRKIPILQGKRRLGDPPILIASSAKIKQELGWQPIKTDFDVIVESALQFHEYHQKNLQDHS